MTARAPWFCPSCQKHHGPHVDTCPDGGGFYAPLPYQGWHERDSMTVPYPCAGCKGACMNVACPKRMVVTC